VTKGGVTWQERETMARQVVRVAYDGVCLAVC
jgi:hypothetical protein